MIELIVEVGHHISIGAALTEEVDSPDEVCDDLTDGVTVLERILWVQHAFVQNRSQLIPLVIIPGRRYDDINPVPLLISALSTSSNFVVGNEQERWQITGCRE